MTKIVDLTKPLNKWTQPYQNGEYQDPPFRVSDWCRIQDEGFQVFRLEMGTQTGTHIDAPAHFVAGGDTLDRLAPEFLLGPYLLVRDVELGGAHALQAITRRRRTETILFLLGSANRVRIPPVLFEGLISLGHKLWVVAGEFTVEDPDAYHFHRRLDREGIYLVEDLDLDATTQISTDGEIIALPLKLEDVSGSPCRVVVSMPELD